MKVSIIGTRGYPSFYGGFETAVRSLAPYFAELGWKVVVYGRRKSLAAESVFRDTRVQSVQTIGLNAKSLSTISYGLTSTLHTIFHRADVALVMNVANGYWLPFLKLFRISTVVNVDGIEWERQKWGKLARLVFRVGAKLTAKFADNLIFDSVSIQEYWREKFNVQGTFIPYGGDFDPGTAEIPSNLEPGKYFLVVARLVPENSISQIFEAIPALSKFAPVVLVGTSGYGGMWDYRASEIQSNNPNFFWFGHVSDDSMLKSLWSKAGVYIHGHTVGGTNPALVQAMACGAFVLAKDTVFNREVLSDTGHFFDETKEDLIEKAYLALLNKDERVKKGRQARQRALDLYTWEKICNDYADVIRSARSK